MYLALKANNKELSTLTIANDDTNTGYYVLLNEANWGNAVWEPTYSGVMGSQGAKVVNASISNRPVVIPIRVIGSNKMDLLDKISDLQRQIDLMRRYEGRITVKLNSQTYRQHFIVKGGSASIEEFGIRAEGSNVVEMILAFSCEPYIKGDETDVVDKFDTDSSDDWTVDSGALSISGGSASPSPASTEVLTRYSANGYTWSNTMQRAVVTLSSGAVVKLKAKQVSNTYLYAELDLSAGYLYVKKMIAGTPTTLGSAALSGYAAGTTCYLRLEVYDHQYRASVSVNPTDVFSESIRYSGSIFSVSGYLPDDTSIGPRVKGQNGFGLQNATMSEYMCAPMYWRREYFATQLASRPFINLQETIPGDAPALGQFMLSPGFPSSDSFNFAQFAWANVQNYNLLQTSGTEAACGNWETGAYWAVTSASGVPSAAATQGASEFQIPGSFAYEGVRVKIFHPFKQGITYRLTGSIRRSTGSGNQTVGVILGNNDTVSAGFTLQEQSVNATTGAWVDYSVDWTPSVDSSLAYAIIRSGSPAWSGYIQFKNMKVMEVNNAPTSSAHNTFGGLPPFGYYYSGHRASSAGRFTYTSATVMRADTSLTVSGSNIAYYIDPSLLQSDDYSDEELVFEVYANYTCASTVSSPQLRADVYTEFNENILYPQEGSDWVNIYPYSSRQQSIKLGTFRISNTNPGSRTPYLLRIWANWTVNSGNLDLGSIVMIPVKQRASSPTNKVANSSYPKFFTYSTGSASRLPTKIITSKLKGLMTAGNNYPSDGKYLDNGLGGALIEIDPGTNAIYYTISTGVVGDPSSTYGVTSPLGAVMGPSYPNAFVHLNLEPRWMFFRS